jgi:hypothetical protein
MVFDSSYFSSFIISVIMLFFNRFGSFLSSAGLFYCSFNASLCISSMFLSKSESEEKLDSTCFASNTMVLAGPGCLSGGAMPMLSTRGRLLSFMFYDLLTLGERDEL